MTIRIEVTRDLSSLRRRTKRDRKCWVMFASTVDEARQELAALDKVLDTYPMIEARLYDNDKWKAELQATARVDDFKPRPLATITFDS